MQQLATKSYQLPQISKQYFDVKSINLDDVPTRYMNPGELEVLVTLIAAVKPRRVIEFGCNSGRTAKVILREIPGIQSYVGIDVLPGYEFACPVQKAEIPPNPGALAMDDARFHLLLRGRGTLDIKPEELSYADAIFIDGDHSYDAVVYDTILATKIVKPGGIIIWHDYHDMPTVDVKKALDRFASEYNRKIIHVENTWLAFERR